MTATRKPRSARGLDHYATPAWCVEVLLPHLPRGPVLDPCAGEGAILDAVRDGWGDVPCFGIEADEGRAATLREKGYSCIHWDGLTTDWPPEYPLVIMNPPYLLAEAFVRHALEHAAAVGGGTVAALLRLAFLEGQARSSFHRDHPADVLALSRRPSFTGGGTDATAYAWFIWAPGRGGRWRVLP